VRAAVARGRKSHEGFFTSVLLLWE
jgi:hypothetical protein